MLPDTFDYENVNIGANTRTYFCAGVFLRYSTKNDKNKGKRIEKVGNTEKRVKTRDENRVDKLDD